MRLVVVVASLFACGCPGPPLTAPAPDECTTATAGSVDSVELGAANLDDLAGQSTPFVPLADGDGVPLIRGGQGATMIGLRLRVTGAQAPDCLMQRTVVTAPTGDKITSSSPPLRTYAQPDGTRVTNALWLPADYPMQFTVDVTAADRSLTRQLHLATP